MPCLQPFRGDSAQLLLYKIASCLSDGGFVAGVSSFNGQTGPVTFTGSDISALLGFTPISQADGDARYVLKAGDTMTGPLNMTDGQSYKYGGVTVFQGQMAQFNFFYGPSGNLTMTGTENIVLGFESFLNNTTGSENLVIGWEALVENTTGIFNIAIGSRALHENIDGTRNIALGIQALTNNTSGERNVVIGLSSMFDNTTGFRNTVVGHFSGGGIVTGQENTILGANVQGLAAGLSNNIILADGAGVIRLQIDSTGAVTTGFLTATGATNAIFAITSDANTATISDTLTTFHRTSGVAAVGFGSRIKFVADTNGAVDQTQATVEASWTVALNATRTSQLAFTTVNSAGGSTDLILSAGQAQFRLGSVSAPSITFQGDLNTGFYSSADVIGLTAGGSNKFFISTTGTFIVGGFHLSYIAKTANYTATAADQTIDCTANTFTITLPTAVGITGRIYTVKNSGVGSITIDPNGAQTIDSLATATVVSGASITTMSNGANWIII